MGIVIKRKPFLIFLIILVSISSVADAEIPSRVEDKTIDGYILTRYTFRDTGKDSDQDIYGELRADILFPEKDRYEIHLLSALRYDIDGNREPRYYYPLEDIGDAYKSNPLGYIYEAHLDINNPFWKITQLRIGRQSGTGDEQIFFDGLSSDIKIADNLGLTAYGGVAAHFFEIDAAWGPDWLAGLGMNYSPFKSTNLNLDYLYTEDRRNIFSSNDQQDRLFSFKIWQQVNPFLKTMARLRYINSDPRDLTVRLVKTFPEIQTELVGNYFRQLSTQKELSNEFSSYYDVMGESHPYETYDLKFRKFFGKIIAIDLGYFERRLIEDRDEGPFNREFKRLYSSIEIDELLMDNLTFAVTGEKWKSDEREFKSIGLDIGYDFNEGKTRLNIGTYYSLYKYDYYLELGERERVRTYYAKLRSHLSKSFSIDTGFEYEDSIEEYKIFKMGIRYDF